MLINYIRILLAMSKSDITEMEKEIGSKLVHFIYRVPKKNHDAMMQLGNQASDLFRKHGAPHLEVFQLDNTEVPMKDFANIAKFVSANQDEEDPRIQLHHGGVQPPQHVTQRLFTFIFHLMRTLFNKSTFLFVFPQVF